MGDTIQTVPQIFTVASPGAAARTVKDAVTETVDNTQLSLEEENPVLYYKRLGLGRGLDVTKSTPWLSKSSFQVRD